MAIRSSSPRYEFGVVGKHAVAVSLHLQTVGLGERFERQGAGLQNLPCTSVEDQVAVVLHSEDIDFIVGVEFLADLHTVSHSEGVHHCPLFVRRRLRSCSTTAY